jgi:hypothetical protein
MRFLLLTGLVLSRVGLAAGQVSFMLGRVIDPQRVGATDRDAPPRSK